MHSTASDGTCTPSELIQMASGLGLKAIAITDHDTLEGSREVLRGTLPSQLLFLSGVEISTQAPDGFSMGGSLHILGYGVDVNDGPLQQALVELQQARDLRIPRIVARLNQAGVPVTMQQVMDQVGEGSPGRPHLARAMILMDVVADVNEAFDRYLSKGQPAYVDKYRIPCQRALELIRGAGGVAVLAHPYLVPNGESEALTPLVRRLCDLGLMGLEVYYPEHSPQAVAFYLDVARRFDLLVTGGTDFHGELIPEIKMGCGRGDLHVPFALYEALTAKIAP
ncbi:MAG: PHP domain-containing protein [Desulfatitalea sp.]|nr:PHP domain-containing protein [Desulfatitalea sp.]